ncbi:hypothetical protein C5Y96_14150 [Blastopirellula marina]|uniref:Uncharacterized protein n=1 Tax=Blastopirellula marina TaxID=124 RepID=A0A2S8FEL4_9BACT|nr:MULTISPECIES: hypothetical protein [Pirellulaceae]PQO30608.1 hypothetical protein C5Y96_14150 [Blastopirellula marina]RCS50745.1 hypothetical protein DTL36_14160 [Bremerella cremea]
MSSTSTPQHDPLIIVRTEKHFLCLACGTLAEIPVEVVVQLSYAALPMRQEEMANESTKTQTAVSHSAASTKAATVTHTRSSSGTTHQRLASLSRSPQPQRKTFVGRQVDSIIRQVARPRVLVGNLPPDDHRPTRERDRLKKPV